MDKPEIKPPDDLLNLLDSEVISLIRKFDYRYEREGKEKMA